MIHINEKNVFEIEKIVEEFAAILSRVTIRHDSLACEIADVADC